MYCLWFEDQLSSDPCHAGECLLAGDNSVRSMQQFNTLCKLTQYVGNNNPTSSGASELPQNLSFYCSGRPFGAFQSCNWLYIKEKGIAEIDGGVFMGLGSVEILSLDSNRLEHLSSDMWKGLDSLRTLYLQDNLITNLPAHAFINLPRLESLALEDNLISSISPGVFTGISNLVFLDLSSNELRYIKKDVFSQLSSLQELSLSRNQLESIDPGSFSQNSQLRILTLDENPLRDLKGGAFTGSSIEYLGLSRTDLFFTSNIWTGLSQLTELNLEESGIKKIRDNMFNGLDSLTDLRLGGNDLTYLVEGNFHGLDHLESLDITENQIGGVMPKALSGLPQLSELNMANNKIETLDQNIFDQLDYLPTDGHPRQLKLVLDLNPIRCDSRLCWIRDGIQNRWLNPGYVYCSEENATKQIFLTDYLDSGVCDADQNNEIPMP